MVGEQTPKELHLTELHLTYSRDDNGYYVDFFPDLDSKDYFSDKQDSVIQQFTVGDINQAIKQVYVLFEHGLMQGIEKVVMEGTHSLPQNDQRVLKIFSKVCNDDFENYVSYAHVIEN